MIYIDLKFVIFRILVYLKILKQQFLRKSLPIADEFMEIYSLKLSFYYEFYVALKFYKNNQLYETTEN